MSKFDHVKHDRQLVSAEEQAAQQADPVNSLKHVREDTKRVMAKLNSADSATVSCLSLLSLVMHAGKDECLGNMNSLHSYRFVEFSRNAMRSSHIVRSCCKAGVSQRICVTAAFCCKGNTMRADDLLLARAIQRVLMTFCLQGQYNAC